MYQQRAIIIIVVLGTIILAVNQLGITGQQNHTPIQTAELQQQIADHPLLYFQTIDINTASHNELLAIPRIGPVLANRIIDFREKDGPFQNLHDLLRVQGIGKKTVQRLGQYCHVKK